MSNLGTTGGKALNRLRQQLTDIQLGRLPDVGDKQAKGSRLGIYLTQMGEKNAEMIRDVTSNLEKQFQQKNSELEARIP